MYVDEKENCLVVEDTDELKIKKITGHSFVGLLGLDSFHRVGDYLLLMHNLIKEKVDKKWLLRGDFAENIIKRVYERDGYNCTTYDKEVVKYDNFSDNKDFGGLIDIELIEQQKIIEVKSKSLKNYEFIFQSLPLNEVYQGLYYARLRNYDEAILEWVFFDEPTEQEIFEGKKPTTLKNLKRLSKSFKVDKVEMDTKLAYVKKIVNDFRTTKKIPLEIISDGVLKQLGFNRFNIDEYDLPF